MDRMLPRRMALLEKLPVNLGGWVYNPHAVCRKTEFHHVHEQMKALGIHWVALTQLAHRRGVSGRPTIAPGEVGGYIQAILEKNVIPEVENAYLANSGISGNSPLITLAMEHPMDYTAAVCVSGFPADKLFGERETQMGTAGFSANELRGGNNGLFRGKSAERRP